MKARKPSKKVKTCHEKFTNWLYLIPSSDDEDLSTPQIIDRGIQRGLTTSTHQSNWKNLVGKELLSQGLISCRTNEAKTNFYKRTKQGDGFINQNQEVINP
jgi:hypothetical protein